MPTIVGEERERIKDEYHRIRKEERICRKIWSSIGGNILDDKK
jgi:hypothetical protein